MSGAKQNRVAQPEAFEIDWERATEPRLDEAVTEGVRPAEGAEPRPGFVRMTLSQYVEG